MSSDIQIHQALRDGTDMPNLSERASGEQLLRPIQVQKLLGIAASTLWNYAHQGLLTPVQRTAGGHGRYAESDVLSLLAELKAVA